MQKYYKLYGEQRLQFLSQDKNLIYEKLDNNKSQSHYSYISEFNCHILNKQTNDESFNVDCSSKYISCSSHANIDSSLRNNQSSVPKQKYSKAIKSKSIDRCSKAKKRNETPTITKPNHNFINCHENQNCMQKKRKPSDCDSFGKRILYFPGTLTYDQKSGMTEKLNSVNEPSERQSMNSTPNKFVTPNKLSASININKAENSKYLKEIQSSAEKYIFSRNHLVSEISKEEIISDILIQSIKSKLKDHSKDEVGNEKKQILDSIKTNFPLKFSSQNEECGSNEYCLQLTESDDNKEIVTIPNIQPAESLPILIIKVNIDEKESYSIPVHEGDNAEELAKEFSIIHDIPTVQQDQLAKLIEQQIKHLLSKIEEVESEQNTSTYTFDKM